MMRGKGSKGSEGKVLKIDRPLAPRVVVAASPQIIKKPTRALRHFDRSEAEWKNLTPQMTKTLPPILVISTEAKRSGEISLINSPGSIEAGDLSTQSIMGAFSICPIPTCSPARDDGVSEQHWTHLQCEGSKGSKGKVLRIDRPYGPEGS